MGKQWMGKVNEIKAKDFSAKGKNGEGIGLKNAFAKNEVLITQTQYSVIIQYRNYPENAYGYESCTTPQKPLDWQVVPFWKDPPGNRNKNTLLLFYMYSHQISIYKPYWLQFTEEVYQMRNTENLWNVCGIDSTKSRSHIELFCKCSNGLQQW